MPAIHKSDALQFELDYSVLRSDDDPFWRIRDNVSTETCSYKCVPYPVTSDGLVFQAELLDALRRRRVRGDCTSDDDEDLGLPHSPCNSPTTADVLLEQGLKVRHHHKFCISLAHVTCDIIFEDTVKIGRRMWARSNWPLQLYTQQTVDIFESFQIERGKRIFKWDTAYTLNLRLTADCWV